MAIDLSPAWTNRIAPAALLMVQEFLNTAIDEPTAEDLRVGEAIRREAALGEAQAALATRHGVSQKLVSAILRGTRAVPAPTLGSRASLRAWLTANWTGEVRTVSGGDQARVLELHRLLMALCLANNGATLAGDVLLALDDLAAGSPLAVRFGLGEASLSPVDAGVAGFVGVVLAAVYDAMHDGSWTRLKACPADRCQHVFYDTSRNRTSTWCSMAICGNRAKVRGYQERVRAAKAK